jgi:hypothetical protein
MVDETLCPYHHHHNHHHNSHHRHNHHGASPGHVPHPGMHKPVFSRVDSETSFTSMSTEPPDYDEALEMLKNGKLVLDFELGGEHIATGTDSAENNTSRLCLTSRL